jgi:hypothetical protein
MIDCPNCITPWKCNGPHLEKSWDGLYNSGDGYFLFSQSLQKYHFIPYEKEYDEDQLLDISNTLRILNDNSRTS